jgi:hypothetical protein
MFRGLRAWQVLVAILFLQPGAIRERRLDRAWRAGPALWRELISLSNASLVSQAVWSVLVRDGFDGRVPPEAADYLAAFHEYNVVRNAAIVAQLTECIRALNAAGIEPMPLKGAAYLLDGLYQDPGERFLVDIDLLIPEGTQARARAALERIGLAAGPATRDYSRHHHLAPMARESDASAVELHTRPVHNRAAAALPTAGLWRAARSRSTDGASFSLPAPTDAVLLSFLHAEMVDRYSSRFLVPLKSLHDLGRLERAFGSSIEWSRVAEQAGRLGASRLLGRHLGMLARLSGTAIDDPLLGAGRPGVARLADSMHFGICTAAAAWPTLTRWVMRIDRRWGAAKSGETVGPEE